MHPCPPTLPAQDSKEAIDIRRLLVFGVSGCVTGIWTDMWFGMLTHFIAPSSLINVSAVTLFDNIQNVALIAIMQAYSAWAMKSSVLNTLKEDFPPMAWHPLAPPPSPVALHPPTVSGTLAPVVVTPPPPPTHPPRLPGSPWPSISPRTCWCSLC